MFTLLFSSAFAASPVWFGAPVTIAPALDYGSDLKTGDINGDGTLDVSVSTGSTVGWTSADRPFSIELALSDGAGAYTAMSVPTSMLSGYTLVTDVGDLDGDGLADLVAGHAGGFSVFFSDGTTLATTVDYTGARVGPVELGDVDADGDLDLLTVDSAGDLNLWTNDGAGAFTLAQALPVNSGSVEDFEWDSVDLVDLDGDGALDVVVNVAYASLSSTVPLHVYLGDGSGLFDTTAWTSATAGGYDIEDLALGDIDGNGSVDFVYGSPWGGELESIEWSGGFGATSTWPIAPDVVYTFLLAGDIDADGDTDLVGTEGFMAGVFLQEGGALVYQSTTYPIASISGWFVSNDAVELVDMDGDGCADLVLALYGVGTSIATATGPGCGGSSGGDTGDTGTADTADTADTGGGAPPPSSGICSVTSPQAGSLALLAFAGLGLIRRRR